MKTYNLPNNRKLKVEQDSFGSNPREWDNITTMLFFGKHSGLGDKHDNDLDFSDCQCWEDNEAVIRKHYGRDLVHIQKVYAYIHSGMTISLSPFSCPWDSGTLGFVIVTRQNIRKCLTSGNVTKKLIAQAIEQVKGEIETLDQYITGEVYRFEIKDEDENHEDSCGGFFGCEIEKNGILDNLCEEDREFVKQQL